MINTEHNPNENQFDVAARSALRYGSLDRVGVNTGMRTTQSKFAGIKNLPQTTK